MTESFKIIKSCSCYALKTFFKMLLFKARYLTDLGKTERFPSSVKLFATKLIAMIRDFCIILNIAVTLFIDNELFYKSISFK